MKKNDILLFIPTAANKNHIILAFFRKKGVIMELIAILASLPVLFVFISSLMHSSLRRSVSLLHMWVL